MKATHEYSEKTDQYLTTYGNFSDQKDSTSSALLYSVVPFICHVPTPQLYLLWCYFFFLLTRVIFKTKTETILCHKGGTRHGR